MMESNGLMNANFRIGTVHSYYLIKHYLFLTLN